MKCAIFRILRRAILEIWLKSSKNLSNDEIAKDKGHKGRMLEICPALNQNALKRLIIPLGPIGNPTFLSQYSIDILIYIRHSWYVSIG